MDAATGGDPGGDWEPDDEKTNSNKSKNIDFVNENYLKKKGIDPHKLKEEFLGKRLKKSRYDIYKNKDTGMLEIYRKGGVGEPIETGIKL